MEEEINYELMRYDLDDDGYILNVYFGCSSGTCIGYIGEIPDEYETIEEWYESEYERLNAWKIVDGNLVYDATRNAQLEKKCAKEEEENRKVCYKEIKNITSIYKQDLYDMYETSTSEEDNILELTDANRFGVTKLNLKSNGDTATTSEAKEHYITDSSDAYCKGVEIFGESTQENDPSPEFPSEIKSVSGKNILPFPYADAGEIKYGVKFTVNEDGSLIVNGTATADGGFLFVDKVKANSVTLKEGKYTLSGVTNGSNSTYYLQVYLNGVNAGVNMTSPLTFIASNTDEITRLALFFKSGTVFNNLVIKPMLEKGSQATYYVPYNHIGFKSVGKNLFNINLHELDNSYTYENNILTTSVPRNAGGKRIWSGSGVPAIDKCMLLKAGTYTISCEAMATNLTPSVFVLVSDGTTLTELSYNYGLAITEYQKLETTFNLIEDTYVSFAFQVATSNSLGTQHTKNIQLEKNTVSTDYEPYKESITTIPLLHDMRSLPNGTRDRIYYSNGKWYDEQRVGEVELDELVWSYDESGTRFRCNDISTLNIKGAVSDSEPSTQVLSNIFKVASNNYVGNPEVYEPSIAITTTGLIRAKYIAVQNVNDFMSMLTNTNAVMGYELAEPIVTEITDEATITALESIKTFKGITNITADAPSILTYVIPIKDEFKIISTNANMLPNEATSQDVSGISFAQNEDKSITLNGTATADIEYLIAGTDTNTKPILHFKKNIDYFLSSGDYTITMYNYDGTDRTQVFSGTGAIKFTDEDKNVTQIVLSIPNGTVIDDVTIYPMLKKGTEADPYVMHESNETTVELGEYDFDLDDVVVIEDGNVTLYKGGVDSEEYHYLEAINMPITYKEKTYLFAYKDTNIKAVYPNVTQNLEYENTSSKNGGFSVDEEGNITAKSGVVGGYSLTDNSLYAEIYPLKDYTDEDLQKIVDYSSGTIELTDEEKSLYDVNGDGLINSTDMALIARLINANVTTTEHGTIHINNRDPVNTIVLKDKDGVSRTRIGLIGMLSNGERVLTDDDTGWIEAELTSDFAVYDGDSNLMPKYRMRNNFVEIRGVVSPTASQSAGWSGTIFTLPEGFRPTEEINQLCQGSGNNKWLLSVKPTGNVVLSRYGATSNVTIPTTTWLPFQIMYFEG